MSYSVKASTEADFFLSEEKVSPMRKELEMWVSMIHSDNESLYESVWEKTEMRFNKYQCDPREVGEETAQEIKEWEDDLETIDAMEELCETYPTKVDGTPHGWSCGCFGSRWCDVIINRRLCRVAFSSRKFNKLPAGIDSQMNYVLSIDASASEVLSDEEIKAHKKSKVCVGCGNFGKTMKSDCCGERYCDQACYKEDYAEHLKRCAIARKMKAEKRSMRKYNCGFEESLYKQLDGETEEEYRQRLTEGVNLINAFQQQTIDIVM
jgi:hypothetical protein